MKVTELGPGNDNDDDVEGIASGGGEVAVDACGVYHTAGGGFARAAGENNDGGGGSNDGGGWNTEGGGWNDGASGMSDDKVGEPVDDGKAGKPGVVSGVTPNPVGMSENAGRSDEDEGGVGSTMAGKAERSSVINTLTTVRHSLVWLRKDSAWPYWV